MKHGNLLRCVILLVLCAVFAVSTGTVIRYAVRSRNEQKAFEELVSVVETAGTPLRTDAPEKERRALYQALKEQNEDFIGWISIEETGIDYPVMYTPDDPEYYLHRAFDQSDSLSGVPFLDAACFAGCGNYLIYGHNMKNGTMFSGLLSYADRDFWKEHPVIRFDTLENPGSYTVLGAFYVNIGPEGEKDFCYYQYTDLRDPADFNSYVGQVKEKALYDTGVSAEFGDTLLTLSTCSYHTENGRFVVVAVEKSGTAQREDGTGSGIHAG